MTFAPRYLPLMASAFTVAALTTAAPAAQAQMCNPNSVRPVAGVNNQSQDLLLGNLLGSFAGSSLGGSSLSPSQAAATRQVSDALTARNEEQAIARPLIESGPTRDLQFITGPSSPARTDKFWGVTSTDLGVAYADASGNTYLAFGDTGHCRSQANDGWRSNVLLRSSDRNYGDGLTIDAARTAQGWQASGDALEFIGSEKDTERETTAIPTAGIVIDGVHYMDYMSVKKWGAPGEWETNYAATMKSTDGGVNWSLVQDSTRVNTSPAAYVAPQGFDYQRGNENLQMSAFIEQDGYVYRMSTPQGRFGHAYLSRAPKAQFPAESAFEYWNGNGWSRDKATVANENSAIFKGPVSELSVTYNKYLGRYIAMYLKEGTGLVVRTSPSLNGPWSETKILVSTSTVSDIYGGFVLPQQDGPYLYYVATTWNDYNVYFMRTDLDFALEHNTTSDNIKVKQVTKTAAQ